MPTSTTPTALPLPSAFILVQQQNPKRKGSKSAARYEIYKSATTLQDYYALGGTKADARHDLKRGFLQAHCPRLVNRVTSQLLLGLLRESHDAPLA